MAITARNEAEMVAGLTPSDESASFGHSTMNTPMSPAANASQCRLSAFSLTSSAARIVVRIGCKPTMSADIPAGSPFLIAQNTQAR
jgi:hypothetical protein